MHDINSKEYMRKGFPLVFDMDRIQLTEALHVTRELLGKFLCYAH
jgi:hypothetical protein